MQFGGGGGLPGQKFVEETTGSLVATCRLRQEGWWVGVIRVQRGEVHQGQGTLVRPIAIVLNYHAVGTNAPELLRCSILDSRFSTSMMRKIEFEIFYIFLTFDFLALHFHGLDFLFDETASDRGHGGLQEGGRLLPQGLYTVHGCVGISYEAAANGVHRSTSRYIRGLEIGRDLAAGYIGVHIFV